jgi:multicomponent Na+:H+ antiporter subunit A
MVLGTGVLISVTTAIVPLLLGGQVLQTGSFTVDLPLLGSMKMTSAMVFDIGVYIAVIGLALMVFESFGDDTSVVPARPVAEREPEPEPPSESQSAAEVVHS